MKSNACIAAIAAAACLCACDSPDPAPQASADQKSAAAPAQPAKPAEAVQSSATPNAADDSDLSNKVRKVLTTASGMEIGGVEIAAADGVVTIYGTVDEPSEKDRAAILALGIDGVRSVVNRLVVIRGS
jgi:osmotically-inducible protein OsmY